MRLSYAYIDSLDGLTFRNQLISILLVMPTGQHLHAIFLLMKETTLVIWGPPKVSNQYQKMLKLDYAFFESMAEKR